MTSKMERVLDSLNCFQIHSVEVYLHGGTLVGGTAINPANQRHYSHTWVRRFGKVIDLMGWTGHEPGDDIFGPMYQRDIAIEVIEWLESENLLNGWPEPVPALCEGVDYDEGPHSGCSEFAPAVEIRCHDKATFVTTFHEVDWSPDSETTENTCDAHHDLLIEWLNDVGLKGVDEVIPATD